MAAEKADALMVLSENMRRYVKDEYGRDSILFYNGVDRPEVLEASKIKERFGLAKDGYILFLSRIVPEKGLDVLIEAFKKAKTDKQLVIAGGADNQEYYDRLQELSKGDERIKFIGYVTGSTVAELYSNAYIFTLPSYLEGMSLSLIHI